MTSSGYRWPVRSKDCAAPLREGPAREGLFFPEKRDSSLENSGIFQFGGGGGNFGAGGGGGGAGGVGGRHNNNQYIRLFFSPRIGLSPSGEAIPILGSTRLTGRAAPTRWAG